MNDDVRTVDLHIPAARAERLGGPGPELGRRAARSLALDAYQFGDLTHFELCQLLGFETAFELDAFLAARGIHDGVTLGNIQRDLREISAFRS